MKYCNKGDFYLSTLNNSTLIINSVITFGNYIIIVITVLENLPQQTEDEVKR